MRPEPTLYIVEDDATVRTSLTWLMESAGYRVVGCSSAEEFLAKHKKDEHGVVILDNGLPGISGTELVQGYAQTDIEIPVIMLTGERDVKLAVRIMRDGARDYLVKPPHPGQLLEVVEAAVEEDARSWWRRRERDDLLVRLESLTAREREVLEQLVKGFTNRDAGLALGISPRTIEVHRGRIMEKMMADTMVDLAARLARHDISL
jgi:two-component system response regulator FixJ